MGRSLDGLARTDGFTSLAVLVGAGGAALGWRLADPIVGLAITAAILLVLRDAAREVFRRALDAVDPALVDRAERALREVPGVREVGELRLHWIGHRPCAEVAVVVDGEVSVRRAHAITVEAEHACCTRYRGSARPWCTRTRRRPRERRTRTWPGPTTP